MLEKKGHLVTSFNEKPELQDFVSGGFFVFNREIFDLLSLDESCTLETTPLEILAKNGQLAIYEHNGFWQCMDTYRDYQILNEMYKEVNTPWMKWGNFNENNYVKA